MSLFDSLKKLSPIGNKLGDKMGIFAPGITGHINRMEKLPGGETIDPLLWHANKSTQDKAPTSTADAAALYGVTPGYDATRDNLSALIAAQNRPSNIGMPTALPQNAQGGTDYAAMLSALQNGQTNSTMPGFQGLQGMRYAPGAGFLPIQQQLSLPEIQAQPQQPQMQSPTAGSPLQNLGIGSRPGYVIPNNYFTPAY